MKELDERLLVVEMQTKQNQEELKRLKALHESLHRDFKELASTLYTIKNWIVGAIAFAVISQIGVVEFVKKMIHF